jgi:hypothetical protein
MTSTIARRSAAVIAAAGLASSLALSGAPAASAQSIPPDCRYSAGLVNVVKTVVCTVEYYIAP